MSKDKLIMEIEIEVEETNKLISEVETVIMITFKGRVASHIFTGEILPGGVDTQVVNANDIKHMSARYMLAGKDSAGMDCKLYIENTGYYHIDTPMPFKTIPKFYTDSKVLSGYLHSNRFRGEGHRENGVLKIKIFEI